MKLNQLKVGVILTYIGMVIQNLISIIYTPIMLRILGQNEYGLFSLVSSVVAYLGLLSFGFGSAFIRYYSKYKAKNDEEGMARVNGMFMMIFCGISVLSVLAGSILILNIDSIFKHGLSVQEINTARILMIFIVF